MKVASGRVWTGNQALENGLVDVLGSLEDAINIAAAKAEVVDDFRIVYYPQEKPWFERFLGQFTNDVQVFYQKQRLGSFYPIYQQLVNIKNYQGLMVRMPYDLDIH